MAVSGGDAEVEGLGESAGRGGEMSWEITNYSGINVGDRVRSDGSGYLIKFDDAVVLEMEFRRTTAVATIRFRSGGVLMGANLEELERADP